MNFFKPYLNLTLFSLLNWTGLAAPVHATHSIRATYFEGNLNSGQGFRTIKGDVTATNDLEDFRKILLTGRTNLPLNIEGIAPNGERID